MSWQDDAAAGNPAADLNSCAQCHGIPPVPPGVGEPRVTPCSFCHDLSTAHFGSGTKRLRAGFENDQANTNCKNCHSWDASEGTAATSPPHFYTTSAAYEAAAHQDQLCTDCHDVHGAAGPYTGMTREDKETLCYQCHRDPTQGGIQNDAVSGAPLADDIEQAFSLPYKHGLGTSLTTTERHTPCSARLATTCTS